MDIRLPEPENDLEPDAGFRPLDARARRVNLQRFRRESHWAAGRRTLIGRDDKRVGLAGVQLHPSARSTDGLAGDAEVEKAVSKAIDNFGVDALEHAGESVRDCGEG